MVNAMQASGLFDRWRVRVGHDDGGYSYWPDGAGGEVVTIDPPSNTAVVGDNDVMFHRVEAVGAPGGDVSLVPIDSHLRYDRSTDQWEIAKGDRTFGRFASEAIRVSVSWKAQVL